MFVKGRKVLGNMLRLLGYQVTATENIFDALQLFQENPGGFDLVKTDMTMPGLTGDWLAT
jgi:CheY-like chemotaxis protein